MPTYRSQDGVPRGASGGACYFCSKANPKSTYVRTFLDLDPEDPKVRGLGEVVVCASCVETMANTLGCGSKRQVSGLKRENARIREENKALAARVAELEELERAIARVVPTGGGTIEVERIQVPA